MRLVDWLRTARRESKLIKHSMDSRLRGNDALRFECCHHFYEIFNTAFCPPRTETAIDMVFSARMG